MTTQAPTHFEIETAAELFARLVNMDHEADPEGYARLDAQWRQG